MKGRAVKLFSCSNIQQQSLFWTCTHLCIYSFFFFPQKKLTTLDIAANRVKKIENISHLTELQEFWVWIVFWLSKICFFLLTETY